jgi:ParB family chromosome partitioning protein
MAARVGRQAIQIDRSRIWVPPGRRPIDWDHVANLAVSMDEIGQRQPIGVSALPEGHPMGASFDYRLNSGAHRNAAIAVLGWPTIDAVVEDDTDADARLAEVDENLMRRDYTALERAQALAARLEAWGAKHPDQVVVDDAGRTRGKVGRPAKLGHGAPISAMGFTEEAAAKAGLSVDTIKRDLAVYRGIPAGLQTRLLETPVASNPGLLRQLAALGDAEEQAAVAEVLISGKTKNLSDARAYAAGSAPSKPAQTPVDEVVTAFRKLWKGASPSARAAVLHELAGSPLPKGWSVTERADG